MNMDALRQKALELWGAAWSSAIDAANHLDQLRLLTPQKATALIFGAAVVLTVPLIWVWLNGMADRRRMTFASVSIPLLLAIMLHVPTGYRGTPDDQCGKYDGGKLNFVLIDSTTVPITPSDTYGGKWLLLLVRAPERWGDEPHQCRLSLADERVRHLHDAIESYRSSGGGYGSGVLHFTFGSKAERPNIRFTPNNDGPGKTGPPEVPRSKQRDT